MKHLLLLLPLMLLACKSEDPAPATQSVGMANPASVYCAEQGGTSLAQTTPKGDAVSICILPTGERIEEWALYRRDHPTPEAPVSEPPAAESPTADAPADVPADAPVTEPTAE